MKNLFFCTISLIVLTSCMNSKPLPELSFGLSIIDNEGYDLLDSTVENSFDIKSIKIYYKIDGEYIWDYDARLDNPGGFMIHDEYPDYSTMQLTFSFNSIEESSNGTTTSLIIKWEEGNVDTLTAEIHKTNSVEDISKIFFNSELKWDINSDEESMRYFIVTK